MTSQGNRRELPVWLNLLCLFAVLFVTSAVQAYCHGEWVPQFTFGGGLVAGVLIALLVQEQRKAAGKS